MTVEKDYRLSLLLDYYGELLTEKQREMVSFYYDDDLSLSEIAENSGITRQGVRDSIKRAEAQLNDFEDKVGFYKYYSNVSLVLDSIEKLCNDIRNTQDIETIKSKSETILKIIEEEKHRSS